MIETHISGIKNAKLRNMFRKAIEYMIEDLCGKRLNLIINVRFGKTHPSIRGMCIPTDWESSRSPREFDIDISSKLSIKRQLETLGHELTHAKQFARNELVDYDNTTTRFRKKIYSSNTPWVKQPWEIEAMGNEEKLRKAFIKEHNIRITEYEKLL